MTAPVAIPATGASSSFRGGEREPSGAVALLTPQQQAILRAYATLGDCQAVAAQLGLSYNTIKNTMHEAYMRLGVSGAVQAFRLLGWLKPDSEAA